MAGNYRTGYRDGWALPETPTPPEPTYESITQGVKVTSGGTETGYAWEAKSLRYRRRLMQRWTLHVNIPDAAMAYGFGYGSHINVVHPAQGKTWAGTVHKATYDRHLGRWELQAVGHRWLAEKRLFAGSFQNVPLHVLIQELLTGPSGLYPSSSTYPGAAQYPDPGYRERGAPAYPDIATGPLGDEGVTEHSIANPGIIVSEVDFPLGTTVADVLDWAADLAGYIWTIDSDRALHWHAPNDPCGTAPITVTGSNVYRPKIEYISHQYRNRQILSSVRYRTAELTETFVADGSQTTFPLRYPVATQPVIAVQAGSGQPWVAQSVGISGSDAHVNRNFFWLRSRSSVSANTANVPPAGAQVRVTYRGFGRGWVRRNDAAEQAALLLADPASSGLVEAVDARPMQSTTEANDNADALLTIHANRPRRLRFETAVSGWGECVNPVHIEYPEIGIDTTGGDPWPVTEVQYRHLGGSHGVWVITAVEPLGAPVWGRMTTDRAVFGLDAAALDFHDDAWWGDLIT